jgi:TRAP-type transport system small permease protein
MAQRSDRPDNETTAPEPGAASVATDATDAADIAAAGGDARSGRGPVTRDDLPLAFQIGDRIFNAVLILLVFLLVVTVGYNVFGRYVLGRSLAWADEGARYLFIWTIFLGAGLAHWRDEHIAVEFFTVKLPTAGRVITSVIKELIILFVLGIMLLGSMNVLRTSPGASPLLGVPYNVINAAVPTAALLMVPMSLYRIVRTLVVRDV